MAATKGRSRTFRARVEVEELLQTAESLGLNISELCNDALAAKMPEMMREKSAELLKRADAIRRTLKTLQVS